MEETTTAAHAPTMPADRKANGKRLRDRVAREAHAGWRAHSGRADPIGILHAADANRQPDLVPLRYGRMLQSPFTFYRGSAGVMAAGDQFPEWRVPPPLTHNDAGLWPAPAG